MPKPELDREVAAKVLLDSLIMGDRAACDKHDISVRSLQRYRLRMQSDPELMRVVALKKAEQDKEWASEIPSAVAAGIQFLKKAAQECDPTNPDAVHAIAGSVKILSEVDITRSVIDARLAGQNRKD